MPQEFSIRVLVLFQEIIASHVKGWHREADFFKRFIEKSRHAITDRKSVAARSEIYQINIRRLLQEIETLEDEYSEKAKVHHWAVKAKQAKLEECQVLLTALDAEDAPTADSALARVMRDLEYLKSDDDETRKLQQALLYALSIHLALLPKHMGI